MLVSWLFVSCGNDTATGESSSAARTIAITATEYEFNGDPGVIETGDLRRRKPFWVNRDSAAPCTCGTASKSAPRCRSMRPVAKRSFRVSRLS